MDRLGVKGNDISARTQVAKIKDRIEVLTKVLPQGITDQINNIMNSDPLPYPEISITNKNRDKAHAVCRRSFELSMLCFAIDKCDCCGTIKLTHVDPDIKNVTFPFARKTFTSPMRKAWWCECDIVCKGKQFFQSQSPLQMKWLCDHHAYQMPHEMLQITINDTNAKICSKCAIDAKPRELCVDRTFSFRNGFGPIINCEDYLESLVLHP